MSMTFEELTSIEGIGEIAANEIIAFCTEKLTKADKEVEKLLQEKRQSEE